MAITSKQVVLRNVRIAFIQQLWTAGKAANASPSAKAKFNCTFLIEKGSDNDKAIQKAIVAATNEKFKANAQFLRDKIKGNSNTCCYIEGDMCRSGDGKIYDGFEGKMALRAGRYEQDGPPQIVTARNIPVGQGQPGAPYGGCYVNAIVEPFAYDNVNKGVSCGLVLVQFAKDGDSFGGASRAAADALPAIEEAEESNGFDEDMAF